MAICEFDVGSGFSRNKIVVWSPLYGKNVQ